MAEESSAMGKEKDDGKNGAWKQSSEGLTVTSSMTTSQQGNAGLTTPTASLNPPPRRVGHHASEVVTRPTRPPKRHDSGIPPVGLSAPRRDTAGASEAAEAGGVAVAATAAAAGDQHQGDPQGVGGFSSTEASQVGTVPVAMGSADGDDSAGMTNETGARSIEDGGADASVGTKKPIKPPFWKTERCLFVTVLIVMLAIAGVSIGAAYANGLMSRSSSS